MGDIERAPVEVGRILADRLRLDVRLASGAMGEVWRARHIGLDKDVAVKLLRSDRRPDPTISERFIREARTASRLNHPNSVAVLDFGLAAEGQLYLAMELLDGETLAATLRERARLPLPEACFLLGQVLAALAAAHEKGVLHRDIKPSNIMLVPTQDDDGHPSVQVKVCDFGLAKFSDARETLSGSGGDRRIIGTPLYMSPEQAVSEPLDERSDLYACGVVLFEMLVGEPPFQADRAVSVLMQHCAAPVPRVSERVEGLDPAVDALVERALEKEREHRFQSARAFRAAVLGLTEARSPSPQSAPAPTVRETSYFLGPGSTAGRARTRRAETPTRPRPPSVEAATLLRADMDTALPIEGPVESRAGGRPWDVTRSDEIPSIDVVVDPPEGVADQTLEGAGLVPPMRVPSSIEPGPASVDARFLWERYALSPHRRPPTRGFWLLDGQKNRVGPLTYDELCVALRLEAHDGVLGESRVAADPQGRMLRPASALLTTLRSTAVGRLRAPESTNPDAPSGWVDPITIPALLVRMSIEEVTGRLILASTKAAQPYFFEVHAVAGRPTIIETNDLSLQLPAILISRGALREEDLPLLVHDAWTHDTTLETSARRLTGLEIEEHRDGVMLRRLRRLLMMLDGTWTLDTQFVPIERRPFSQSLLSTLPRMIGDGLSSEFIESALLPHLGRALGARHGISETVERLGFTSRERTIAEELLSAPRITDALPAQGELRKAYATVAYILVASTRRVD